MGADPHVVDACRTQHVLPDELGIGQAADSLNHPTEQAVSEVGVGILFARRMLQRMRAQGPGDELIVVQSGSLEHRVIARVIPAAAGVGQQLVNGHDVEPFRLQSQHRELMQDSSRRKDSILQSHPTVLHQKKDGRCGEGRAAGKHEAFLNIDARHFYDTADACINALQGLDAWRYEGEIDEELDNKQVHVKLAYGKPKPGMPLLVFEEGLGENDQPIGVVYVVEPDERGAGFVARWIAEQDKSKKKKGEFGLGTRVSNARYKYRIAIGKLDDEAEGNEQLVTMFREKLNEKLEESDKFIGKNDSNIQDTASELGKGDTRKQNLKKLHQAGVDFLIEGKFIGSPGERRADFKVISAATGEVWGTLKFETRI